MPQMTKAEAQIVDPVLTNVAIGYGPTEFVGSLLFPNTPVQTNSGKIAVFGKEARVLHDSERAPGAVIKRVMQSYGSQNFSLPDFALEAVTPVEHIRQGRHPGINLLSRSVLTTRRLQLIEREYIQSQLARNLSNYGSDNKVTLAAGTRWSQSTSTPLADVEAGKEAVRQVTGGYVPNVLLISYSCLTALRKHPDVLDSVKYTGTGPDPSKITTAMLAAYFGVQEVRVGQGSYVLNKDAGFTEFWGDDAILAFTELGSMSNEMPSFGYTYQMENYPIVEEAYYEKQRKSWINGVSDAYQPIITMTNAAYIFKNAGDNS